MQNVLKNLFAHINTRKFRRKTWRWLLRPLFRAVDATRLDAGELRTSGIHRILVLRPNHRLGNLVLITPLLTELEQTFPGAEIDVLTAGESAHEVLANFPSVRHIRTLPHYVARHPLRTLKTIRSLRGARYDLAVSPATDSYSSRVLIYWAKAPRLIGIPPNDSSGTANWDRILPIAPQHFAMMPVFMLRHTLAAGPGVESSAYPPLDIRLTADEKARGQQTLDAVLATRPAAPGRVPVGIFADASGAKRFDTSWWLRFLGALTDAHPEYAIVEFIPVDGRSRLEDRFPSYFSSSLRQFASTTACLACFISADGGIMHLASASGVPTIGMFSVTNPLKYAPYGRHNQACDTLGKPPEEVAQAVGDIVETILNGPEYREIRLTS